MQIFKMLINSLPYKFQNVVFIGDFPKSTIHAAATLNSDSKVLCNLNSALEVDGIAQQPFPIVDSFTNLQNYQNANLKGFSSLKAPAGIKQLLPGIIFDQAPLHYQPLDNLIQNLSMPEGSSNLAVLNLNGAEHEYLVESEILLNTFCCVLISCSSSNIFEGAAESYKKLLAHFEAQNIAYSEFPAEVHPFSFILIHRMPNWKVNVEAMAAIRQQNEQSQKALEDALNHEQERSRHFEDQINEQRSTIDALTNEKQELQASCGDLNAKCEKLEQDKQWVEEELRKAKGQVEEQSQSVKIANKLNLKLQVDLDDLRQKYSEKEQNERELSQLIDELYVKLKQASEFYYELEKKYPELTDEQRD